jgi:hypothetical protein
MTSPVETRAIALYEGESLGHGFGYCKWTDFHQLDWLPAHGETLDVQMWFFWMGTEKMTSIPVTVNALPYCDAEADPGEGGPAPLEVHFYGSADDPDGGALSLSWDLGDGTTVGGELEPVHTYEIPDTYDVQFTVTDALGGKCYSEFSIWVQ